MMHPCFVQKEQMAHSAPALSRLYEKTHTAQQNNEKHTVCMCVPAKKNYINIMFDMIINYTGLKVPLLHEN